MTELNILPSTDLNAYSLDFQLQPDDNQRLANLCGQFNENLNNIESRLSVVIHHRGSHFHVTGLQANVEKARVVLSSLYKDAKHQQISLQKLQIFLQESSVEELMNQNVEKSAEQISIRLRKKVVKARGYNQIQYINRMQSNDICFGIGPAGTGKTYLAVAMAVKALEEDQVRRLILARPAVEAGERLGFLPGDLSQKIDPYLRPLYDALYEMLGFEYVIKLIEKNVIEVAPLAFMRGRTLNEAFIILDEAQNTTREQMKMFLTRLGFGSKAIVTGDVTQTDLPDRRQSGLNQAADILKGIKGVSFTYFNKKDVVRHLFY